MGHILCSQLNPWNKILSKNVGAANDAAPTFLLHPATPSGWHIFCAQRPLLPHDPALVAAVLIQFVSSLEPWPGVTDHWSIQSLRQLESLESLI